MRDGGDQLAARSFLCAEPGGHRVDIGGQLPQLVCALDYRASGVFAAANTLQGATDLLQVGQSLATSQAPSTERQQ